MKTLKSISLTILFFAIVALASANESKKLYVTTADELKDSFRNTIQNDFSEPDNFLYKNDVSRLNESVDVIFLINPDQTVRILRTKCNNPIAADYVKSVLDNKKVKVTDQMVGVVYHLQLTLVYKSI